MSIGGDCDVQHLLDLDGNAQALARRFWRQARLAAPRIFDEFYTEVAATGNLSRLVDGRVEALKAAQMAHWDRLFMKPLDQDYLTAVAAVGRAHARIGLSPQWYMSAYGFLLSRLTALAVEKNRFRRKTAARTSAAVISLVMFDMAQALKVYQDIEDEKREARQQSIVRIAKKVAEKVDTTNEIVHHLSAATTELESSVQEITEQASRSSAHIADAGEEARRVQVLMAELEQSAQAINSVVGLISSVAEQTNLLALNATIEASHAGSAGKGFSVVANEVKALAIETGRSSKDISRKITDIQERVNQAAGAVDGIAARLATVAKREASIAAAVEEQSLATGEIRRQILAVEAHSDAITKSMHHMSEGGEDVSVVAA